MDNNHGMGKTPISMNVVAVLENIRAANIGAMASCSQTVYEIFEPILYHLAELLDLFHNYNYVIVEIFQVLCSVVQNLPFLQTHKVYEICAACIRSYVKHSSKYSVNTNRITVVISIHLELFSFNQLISIYIFFSQIVLHRK